MGNRDRVFDLLMEISDFAMENGLPVTSYKVEAALDAFLVETGRIQVRRAPSGPHFRSERGVSVSQRG